MDQALKFFLSFAALIFSIIFHEQSHARVALWLGDPTGKNQNRLSWNPLHHLDPFMSVILPGVLYLTTRGQFIYGGAKPCPVNALNFKNPVLGHCLSAVAGPLSNYLLAAAGFALLAALYHFVPSAVLAGESLTLNGYFFVTFIITNVFLGSFNLLPIPPLDGSRILYYFSPPEIRSAMDVIEPYGLPLTMLLVYFGAAKVVYPVINLCYRAILEVTGPDFWNALVTTL